MYTLIIGNKNYSSWSLRAWLLLKQFQIEFTETRIPLHTSTFQTGNPAIFGGGKGPDAGGGRPEYLGFPGDLRVYRRVASGKKTAGHRVGRPGQSPEA